MTNNRLILISVSSVAVMTTLIAAAAAYLIGMPAAHAAQVVIPPIVTDPASADSTTLLTMLLSAQYLPLTGAALVLIVKLLRSGGIALTPWFGTKLGGYLLSFGTTFGLYIGGTLQGGGSVTYPLIATALVMTFAAAGGWEAIRDVWQAMTGASSGVVKKAGTAALVLMVAMSLVGCATAQKIKTHANEAGKAIVECGTAEKDKLTAFTLTLAIKAANDVITTGKVDWDGLEAAAWAEATAVGTCAYAAYYAATHPEGESARTLMADPALTALERLRAKAGIGGWQLETGRSL